MRLNRIFPLLGAIALMAAGCSPKPTTQDSNNVSIETDTKDAVGSLLFEQKTYFLENQRFASSVKDLRGGVLAQTKSYTYRLKAKPNKEQGMTIAAIAKKPGLRSFTGVVFAVKTNKGQPMTISQICETKNPSKLAPTAPATPKRPSDQIRCPSGSRSSFEIIAQQ